MRLKCDLLSLQMKMAFSSNKPSLSFKDRYVSLFSKVVSLNAEHNQLPFAVPGGLIGVGTFIDPSLCRADRLVGKVNYQMKHFITFRFSATLELFQKSTQSLRLNSACLLPFWVFAMKEVAKNVYVISKRMRISSATLALPRQVAALNKSWVVASKAAELELDCKCLLVLSLAIRLLFLDVLTTTGGKKMIWLLILVWLATVPFKTVSRSKDQTSTTTLQNKGMTMLIWRCCCFISNFVKTILIETKPTTKPRSNGMLLFTVFWCLKATGKCLWL